MRKERINGHDFEFYNEISEMPVSRFHIYSRYMLVVSGIGDTLDDIDKHMNRIMNYMMSDLNKARQELLNLRQCLFMVANEKDVRYRGFLALTYKVDGKVWDDFSEEGMERLYYIANQETIERLDSIMTPIISNIDEQLRIYFPDFFSNSLEKNYTELLRKRALLQADYILTGVNHDSEIDSLNSEITRLSKTDNFEGDATLVEFDKQFEEMCMLIAKEFNGSVKEHSVMEFYTAYQLMEKQAKEYKKLKK